MDLNDTTTQALVIPMHICLLSSLCLLFATGLLPSQSRIGSLPSEATGFGSRLYHIGDVDADGSDDVLIQTGSSKTSSFAGLELWSPSRFRMLQRWDAKDGEIGFGESAAVIGDLDSDGKPEVLVGVPRYKPSPANTYGKVICYSTGTGKRLFELSVSDTPSGNADFGFAVAGPGDLDLDGVPDMLISMPSNQGYVYGFSGKTLKRLFRIDGQQVSGIGMGIVPVGDVDADRVPDFALVCRSAVLLISGKARSQLWSYPYPASLQGSSVLDLKRIGDSDQDKLDDLFLGLYGLSQTTGAVLLSSKTGKLLRSLNDPYVSLQGSSLFGQAVEGLPDEDLDGSPELAVLDANAHPPGGNGLAVYVFSSKTGQVLRTLVQRSSLQRLGATRMIGVGDVNGDRRSDLLLGDPTFQRQDGNGLVEVYSSGFLDMDCNTQHLSLFRGGQAVIDIHGGASQAGALVLVVGSAGGTLPGLGFGGQTLLLNPDAYLSFTLSAPLALLYNNLSLLDTNGEGKVGFTLPALSPSSLGGTVLHHSAILVGKPGLRFANTSVRLALELF